MRDSRCFVQLIHPGGEHYPDEKGLKHWNEHAHGRKFLRTRGRYYDDGRSREDDLVFWGEWEPESRVLAEFERGMPGGPRFLYEPFFVTPVSQDWRQNTDPFVFGEQFQYTGCLQHTRLGPTQLRNLAPGSLILFGSCLGKSDFVVDTVMVIGDFVDHTKLDYQQRLANVTTPTYRTVTIEPWYHRDSNVPDDRSHRLYFGATLDRQVDGMFSFFPCQRFDPSTPGFPRPTIDIRNFITPNLAQGKKIARDLGRHELKELWDKVVDQVIRQGCYLGVHANLPPEVSQTPKVIEA